MIPRTRCPRPVRMLFRKKGHMPVHFGGSEWACRSHALCAGLASSEARSVHGVRRVLASAGKHVRGSESSEGVSTFRIVLQKSFDDALPTEAERAHHALGERGLAQSGRPRRAKWRWGSSRGGKTVRSAPAFVGTGNGVAVVGLRSMKGASGRSGCSFSRKERRKRSWPILPEALARNRQRSTGG